MQVSGNVDGSPILFPVPESRDWKKQTTNNIMIGATSPNRNNYTWHEETNITQGVRINLIPAEKVPIYLQQSNAIINFELNDLNYMIDLQVNINGQGYYSLYNGSSVTSFKWSNAKNIFNTIGEYNLKVQFTNYGGTIFYREYDVFVIKSSDKLYKDNYCNTLRCWQGNNPNEGIPIVFSEGFDTYDCTTQEFYFYVARGIFDCLLNNGYNVYLLDNKFGTQDIRNNAAGFDAAVRYVSSINDNKAVIAGGASMGGMIARYAFAKAEHDGVPLPASKFVSIDSPQKGAVISKSLQNFKKTQQAGDVFLEHALNNTAAKQLLTHNVYDPNAGQSNSIHAQFYNELNSLNGNGYPHLTTNIGVAFSHASPNPHSGKWIKIECADWYGSCPNYPKEFALEPDELQAGSYLPNDLTMMSPTIMHPFAWYWSAAFGTLWAYPLVWVARTQHPCYIPHESALDIVNGQSKFDIVIQSSYNEFHDVVPPEIIDPLVNAIMLDNDIKLQNQTLNDAKTYQARNTIKAGYNVNGNVTPGNVIVSSGANVDFFAGQQIHLLPGFNASYNFNTKIVEPQNISCDKYGNDISEAKNVRKSGSSSVNMKTKNPDLIMINENNFKYRCYPNPTADFVYLEISNLSIVKSIALYNMFNQQNFELTNFKNENTIDLRFLSKGIYFLKIETAEGCFIEKIILQ